MISKLSGLLDSVSDMSVVIDVGGVGYRVHCSSRSVSRLPNPGQPVTLFIEMIIRENTHTLLGFCTLEERECYRLLTSVQGVGMRVALALLSIGEPSEIAAAIFGQDKAFIARAEGVGTKLAARIINELKDKTEQLNIISVIPKGTSLNPYHKRDVPQDAVSALTNLGYRQHEATQAIEAAMIECGEDAIVEQLIRSGLVRLSRS